MIRRLLRWLDRCDWLGPALAALGFIILAARGSLYYVP